MALNEDPKGAPTPQSDGLSANGAASEPNVAYSQTTDDAYGYNVGQYSQSGALTVAPKPAVPAKASGGGGKKPPPPPPPEDPEDGEEGGMLRMSFLEHLEELRSRIIKMVAGVGIAFLASLFYCNQLWLFVQEPAEYALKKIGINPPRLIAIAPMDQFNIVWIKLPILASVFLSSPWIIYQIWSFIAPGLYKKERRWAAPFVICTAGLFIAGGCLRLLHRVSLRPGVSAWHRPGRQYHAVRFDHRIFRPVRRRGAGRGIDFRDADRHLFPDAAAHRNAPVPHFAEPLRDF